MIQLLQDIETMEPILRTHAARGEAIGHLPDEVVQAMRALGLYHMSTPARLGGLELNPIEIAQVIERVSEIDSAAGWGLTNPTGCGSIVARCPEDGIAGLLAETPLPMITGSLNVPLHATPEADGFRVRGKATLVSNFREADYILMALLPEPDAAPAPPTLVLVPTSACRITREWNGLGMRGTGTVDVEVEEVFIPATRSFAFASDTPLSRHHAGDLYRFPVIAHCLCTFAPVALGVARQALAAIESLVRSKVAFSDQMVLLDRETTHAMIGEAHALYRSARHTVYHSTGEMWEKTLSGKEIGPADKAASLADAVQVVRSCATAVQIVFDLAGSDAIQAPNIFERCQRDVALIKNHGYFSWRRYASVGKALLGLESEFAMIYV